MPGGSRWLILLSTQPGWRNWQTRYLEVVEPARVCRFKSCPGHYRKKCAEHGEVWACWCVSVVGGR